MHPATHLLVGWTVAESAKLQPRDRTLVAVSGVIPDIDGLGLVAELATRDSAEPLYWWSEYHHVLCHNLGFGILLAVSVALLSIRRRATTALAVLAFHLHLLGDLVGSKGPDGYTWPIPYLLPFSRKWQLTWSGQWALNAWPNVALTAALLALAFYLAWKRGYSPLGMLSVRMDAVFIETLRKRFGEPG